MVDVHEICSGLNSFGREFSYVNNVWDVFDHFLGRYTIEIFHKNPSDVLKPLKVHSFMKNGTLSYFHK